MLRFFLLISSITIELEIQIKKKIEDFLLISKVVSSVHT